MNDLTAKEREVLSLVSSGLTTKEIAVQLHISHHTVESHRKNLLRKCRAKNSAELIQKILFAQFASNAGVAIESKV
jgi:two-component system, NarL family, response regulator NreC